MRIPLGKLKAILLYFTNKTDARFLGKVKLMKLIYFLDFMHLKEYGTPVTYDTYVNLEHGPVPSTILNLVNNVLDDVDSAELSDTISIEPLANFNMYRISPTRAFAEKDRDYLSESEMDVLEKVCMKFGDKNTNYIESASHSEAPWKETTFLQEIPYTLAANDPDSKVEKEDLEFLLKLENGQ